jgi:hypothetical protein
MKVENICAKTAKKIVRYEELKATPERSIATKKVIKVANC